MPADELQNLGIVKELKGALATGNEEHVSLRSLGKGCGRQDHEPRVGGHWIRAVPCDVELRIGIPREDLGRAGEIQLRDVRERQSNDGQRRLHALSIEARPVMMYIPFITIRYS